MGHVGEEFRLVAIGRLDLTALVFDLAEQPGIVDRQSRLGRKGLQQIHHLGSEFTGLASQYRKPPENLVLAKKRHRKKRAVAETSDQRARSCSREFLLFQYVLYLHWHPSGCRSSRSAFAEAYSRGTKPLNHFLFHAVGCSRI